ncbi:MAG: hypothetical protein ACRDRX_06490, partial [Pseudonocardiaceae bacterium]
MSQRTKELRFALAIRGGVSLAVWMGGACRELALMRCPQDQGQCHLAKDDRVAHDHRFGVESDKMCRIRHQNGDHERFGGPNL